LPVLYLTDSALVTDRFDIFYLHSTQRPFLAARALSAAGVISVVSQ